MATQAESQDRELSRPEVESEPLRGNRGRLRDLEPGMGGGVRYVVASFPPRLQLADNRRRNHNRAEQLVQPAQSTDAMQIE